MTHYSNLAEARRAEAVQNVMATGGHVVDVGTSNLARLAEILEDHHEDAKLCKEHGLSTAEVDAVAKMELAELKDRSVRQPNLLLHYQRVEGANRCLMLLERILGAKSEDERQEILAEYDRRALRGVFEAAAYDAAFRGDYAKAYEVTHGVKTIPALRKVIFVA
ncbi:MAG: hypothetical protein K6F57_02305 [Candidatus Saccharibacteria bacterium]|nr:hypothetical protein [Candidatus Saccharibacteria bacterium]